MITYFLSYISQGTRGMDAGNCELTRPQPITSMDDIRAITELLREQGLTNPTVMSFTRFDSATRAAGIRRIK